MYKYDISIDDWDDSLSYVVNIIITHSERALFDLNARVEAQGGIVPEAVGI